MIDVKEAVKIAFEYVSNLFDKDSKIEDLRLEEVEISDKEDYWYVTLSFVVRRKGLVESLPTKFVTEYKKVKIDAGTGEVKSVTVRNIDVEARV